MQYSSVGRVSFPPIAHARTGPSCVLAQPGNWGRLTKDIAEPSRGRHVMYDMGGMGGMVWLCVSVIVFDKAQCLTTIQCLIFC